MRGRLIVHGGFDRVFEAAAANARQPLGHEDVMQDFEQFGGFGVLTGDGFPLGTARG